MSIEFIFFIAATLLLYFIFPDKWRWLILLGASMYFYSSCGIIQLLFVLITAGIAYITSCNIEAEYNRDNSNKKKARKHLISGMAIIIIFLLYAKIGSQVMNACIEILFDARIDVQTIVPLGISYYTFSVIGYMADVYWRKETAEHSYLKLLLYMIYFPHILLGPIPRHGKLAYQLTEGHSFQYQNLCYGLQRMLWGYFKKMVIADRFALITKEVFGNYGKYEGLVFVAAAVCAAIELYCDFSGCMDIVLGISEVLSIQLDENFQRPFFAGSAAEFWRRWHITLGTWFKDYVYMPLAINPRIIRFCQRTKKRFGNRFAKGLLNAIPLAIVWILTGVWHGTGMNYIAWGIYWGSLIIVSNLFATEIKKATLKLKINTDSGYFQIFRVVRTFILFLISRLLTVPGDINVTWTIIHRIFMNWNPEILCDGTLYMIGLDQWDLLIGILSVWILWIVECLQEKGIKIRARIASYPLILRWGIYYTGIFAIVIFGIYGSGVNVGEDTFIYMYY